MNGVDVSKVEIDEGRLNPGGVREVTLIIPGEVHGKQVNIEPSAFRELNSNRLRLNIQFKKAPCSKGGHLNPMYVQMPKDCSKMFSVSDSITGIDFSGASLAQIKNAKSMFDSYMNLTNIRFGDSIPWQIEDMSYMFALCVNIVDLDISHFSTSRVTDMSHMFGGCKNIKVLDFHNFNTSKVMNMSDMFNGCKNLTNLDLSSFNTRNVTKMDRMFFGCENLATLKYNGNFVMPQRRENMFYGCNAVIIH